MRRGEQKRSSPRHQFAWTLVNLSSAPVWLAMILFPRSEVTRWMADRLVPLYMSLGVVYTGALALGAVENPEPPDFGSLEKVQELLQNPSSMLAAWTHYIAFDLFVGRWIWERSLEQGRPARLSLLLTWWAGPLGLTLFLGRGRFG